MQEVRAYNNRWALSFAFIRRARQWLIEQVYAQRAHAFLWSPFFIGAGILLYFHFPFEPPLFVGMSVLFLSSVALLFTPSSLYRYLLGALLLVSLGFSAGVMRAKSVHTPIVEKEIKFATVKGHVEKVEILEGQNTYRVLIAPSEIEKLSEGQTPRYVRVKVRSEQPIKPGQYIELLAGLNPPSSPVIPNGFDFRRYMYFQGIGAVGFSYGAPKVLRDDSRYDGWFSSVEGFRNDVSSRAISSDPRNGAIVSALIVGQRRAIYDEDNEALRASGLAHMLAISGLHIGLFFGVVFFCVRAAFAAFPAFALKYPIKSYAAVAAIIAAGFYMVVAGATIPTQRALMMIALVFVAVMLNRTALSLRLVAFAASVVLLIAPESLLYPSFQMSFAAVAALVAFFKAIQEPWSNWYRNASWGRKIGLYALGLILTTLIASLATAPFAMFHFNKFASLSIVANLLAMPVLAFFVMPLAVICFLLMPLGLEGLVLPLMNAGVAYILDVAHFVSSFDVSVLQVPASSGVYLLIFAVGFFILIVGSGSFRWASIPFFTLSLLLNSGMQRPDILVSQDGALVSYAGEDGRYHFSNMRKDKFTRERWADALALSEDEIVGWEASSQMGCDEFACRIKMKKQNVSILYKPEMFDGECLWADIIISAQPLPRCPNAYVIDRFDVYRNGAASVFLNERKPKIQYASRPDYNRPWSADAKR